jgi:hypothetical protein
VKSHFLFLWVLVGGLRATSSAAGAEPTKKECAPGEHTFLFEADGLLKTEETAIVREFTAPRRDDVTTAATIAHGGGELAVIGRW